MIRRTIAWLFLLFTIAVAIWAAFDGHAHQVGSVLVSLFGLDLINLLQASIERYVGSWLWSPLHWFFEQTAWVAFFIIALLFFNFAPNKEKKTPSAT